MSTDADTQLLSDINMLSDFLVLESALAYYRSVIRAALLPSFVLSDENRRVRDLLWEMMHATINVPTLGKAVFFPIF